MTEEVVSQSVPVAVPRVRIGGRLTRQPLATVAAGVIKDLGWEGRLCVAHFISPKEFPNTSWLGVPDVRLKDRIVNELGLANEVFPSDDLAFKTHVGCGQGCYVGWGGTYILC